MSPVQSVGFCSDEWKKKCLAWWVVTFFCQIQYVLETIVSLFTLVYLSLTFVPLSRKLLSFFELLLPFSFLTSS